MAAGSWLFPALILVCGTALGAEAASGQCPASALIWGASGAGPGQFAHPAGIDRAPDGRIYVADQWNERVEVFDPTGTFVRSWTIPGGQNGYAYPTGLCVSNDVVWVSSNQGWQVTRWTLDGTFLGLAGAPAFGWNYPSGIASDPAGDIFVCDYLNNRVVRLDSSGALLGEWASRRPTGIDIDTGGRVYVSEDQFRVAVYDLAGTHLAEWSSPSGSWAPQGIAHDRNGDLFVCDGGVDRVLKFSPSGVLLCTLGRTGTYPGQLDGPNDATIDADGGLIVSEYVNNRIQVFTDAAVPATTTTWGRIKVLYR